MDIDIAEMEADTICTHFKKLTPKERSWLAKEDKCFYCKKPRHMVCGCPFWPKQRFPPWSQLRFQLRCHMMQAMEEEEGGDQEDQEEGKQRVAHIQQIIMGLSMDEIEEVRAFSKSKKISKSFPLAVDMERSILAGNWYAPLASKDTNQEHGHPDILYLSEMKSHSAPSL